MRPSSSPGRVPRDPASIEALLALLDAKDPAARLWMAALNGASSGSGRLLRYLLNGGAEWPRMVGFDFMDVRSELAFGQPPGDGIVLQGDFDPDRIGAALSARDFTSTDAGPFTLWCRSDGCDKGLEQDLAGRDPADPFGGELGRRQPLAVSEDTLLSSAAIDTVDAMLATTLDVGPSLADDGSYAAVAEALAGDGTLIQATLVPGTQLLLFDPVVIIDERTHPRRDQETTGRARRRLRAHPTDLPAGHRRCRDGLGAGGHPRAGLSDPRRGAGRCGCPAPPPRNDDLAAHASALEGAPGRAWRQHASTPVPSNARMATAPWRC